jgi:putative membrane-bound dehydrogenase-like protein
VVCWNRRGLVRLVTGLVVCGAVWVGLSSLAPTPGPAAEPAKQPLPDFAAELPRIPPHEPAAALETFRVHPGFHLEQVAAEPLVHSPVAVAWDENGRLYVSEMIDYSEQGSEHLGAIRWLEDTDADGKYDRTGLLAEKLSWPTALCCYDGGVFVGAAPDIYYLKDTDGDGQADVRKTVFTGFSRSNVQGLINSFHWGLDNRIHGATGTVGGAVKRPDIENAPAVVLNGRDFSFDPKLLDLRAETGGAQHGMSFNDWGRKFHCSNSDHIQLTMYEDRYAARNPYLAGPASRISIAADGPQAEVFRISPVEPWRIVRTRLRVTGAVVGAVEGGGRAAGYFTGATGTTIYRGDAFGPEYIGQAFVGDVGSNIVHRKVLEPNSVGFIAKRADEGKEFVASTDIWFRPAAYANGPDGCLTIVDVYREVIEHPASLPPEIKKHLDLTSGRDRGRLYRLAPDGYKPRPNPTLGKASTAELVAALESRNGWTRDAASRLLFQKADSAAVPLLIEKLLATGLPEGRVHALYALASLGALSPDLLVKVLGDSHPRVREHAVRLSESKLADAALVAKLVTLTADDDLRVRYQLAFVLGSLPAESRVDPLIVLAKRDGGDSWMRFAILNSLSEGGASVFDRLVADTAFRATPNALEFLGQLCGMIGQSGKTAEIEGVLKTVIDLPEGDAVLAGTMARSLYESLGRGQPALRQKLFAAGTTGATAIGSLVARARVSAGDTKAPLAARVEAVRTLSLGNFAESRSVLEGLIGNQQPDSLQLAALSTLGKLGDAAVPSILIDVWPKLSPRVRGGAADLVFSRGPWVLEFLAAVAEGKVAATDVEPSRLKTLEKSSDPAVQKAAAELLAKLKVGRRGDVLALYRPALELKGDPKAGKLVFTKICATCHKVEGQGYEIGPNLASFKARGAEAILLNVIDPNSEVNPQYINYACELEDGRTVTGMIAAETATSVSFKRAENATDTVLRSEISELRSTGQSIMPEGMEKDITPQAMADLIAYLLTAP